LVLSASAVLVLIGVAILFEPFAPRYQGRTVDQWLNFGAAEGEFHLGTNIISAFGPNALPTLLKATRERFWLRRVCRWSETVKADSLKRLLYKTSRQILADG
jgi:hypothetical protein